MRVSTREVLVVTHSGRAEAVDVARRVIGGLTRAGVTVRVPPEEAADLAAGTPGQAECGSWDVTNPGNCDLVVVIGGDGTILRAAEYAVAIDVPLLGVNLGHVGFLAEVESDNVPDVVRRIVNREYRVEERTALAVRVLLDGQEVWRTWALNEAAIEKASRERMIDVMLEIAGHPLSRWGCDGVVVATPTGSTAYAWSVGGPVIWPRVAAMMVAPISAHALFAKPLVVDPKIIVALELAEHSPEAVVWCDGRRLHELKPGSRVEVTANERPVRFARMHDSSFTDRLVRKFALPVEGWRGRAKG